MRINLFSMAGLYQDSLFVIERKLAQGTDLVRMVTLATLRRLTAAGYGSFSLNKGKFKCAKSLIDIVVMA